MIESDILISINDKFGKALKSNQTAIALGACNYNPHLAVRKKHEEVGLHSNFLYSLLNPRGDHFRGGEFLYSFLTAINAIDENKDKIDKFSEAIVTREKHKIDLLIETPDHWYIIENKVYAADQDAQISRYINIVKEKYKVDDSKITVIYLTLSGVKPSKKSLKTCTDKSSWSIVTQETKGIPLILASYKQIRDWCGECLTQSYVTNSPALYYSIASYKQVLDRLLGEAAAGIPPLGGQRFPVMSHEDFFLSLTDTEKEEFINAANTSKPLPDPSSYTFLTTSLVANGKIKSPRALLQSIFNNLLLRFRDGVYSEAAMHGFVIANTRDGLKLNGKNIKLLKTPVNWYTEKEKRAGRNQFMAFKPRGADDGFWYVIYFATHAFYQGFIEVDPKTKELKKFDHAIDEFKKHEYDPCKDKILSSALGIVHYEHNAFVISSIKTLTNSQNFFKNVMKKSMEGFWSEHVVSPNDAREKHFLTSRPINF